MTSGLKSLTAWEFCCHLDGKEYFRLGLKDPTNPIDEEEKREREEWNQIANNYLSTHKKKRVRSPTTICDNEVLNLEEGSGENKPRENTTTPKTTSKKKRENYDTLANQKATTVLKRKKTHLTPENTVVDRNLLKCGKWFAYL